MCTFTKSHALSYQIPSRLDSHFITRQESGVLCGHINSIRDKILDVAVELIIEEGFKKLSMRKIALRLGVTATNLYYYFANKDEINIMIRVRCFHMLYDKLLVEYNKYHSPSDRHRATVWAFVDFGTTYPDYYDIMYNLRTPKYANYVGTKLETAASYEKLSSTRTLRITMDILAVMMGKKIENQEENLKYKAIRIWSDLHGIISIYNSRVLFETAENDKEILDRRVNEVIDETIASCATELPYLHKAE
jgi:AcrR family transcriptional regulator